MNALNICVIVLMVAIFIFGSLFLMYPHIHGMNVDREIEQAAHSFMDGQNPAVGNSVPPVKSPPHVFSEGNLEPIPNNFPALWEAMHEYNACIWEEKQAGLCNQGAYTQPSFDLENYGLENQIFGVISIPALDLEMPIYLGATNQHMSDGAAHLSQTSLPIGGVNCNSVIAGHRGFNGADYFRYLPQLMPGDEVIITNLWETLHYTVTETKIIMPNDIDQILIREGRDMITLITCHPYASGGRQRFLVFCDRSSGGTK